MKDKDTAIDVGLIALGGGRGSWRGVGRMLVRAARSVRKGWIDCAWLSAQLVRVPGGEAGTGRDTLRWVQDRDGWRLEGSRLPTSPRTVGGPGRAGEPGSGRGPLGQL